MAVKKTLFFPCGMPIRYLSPYYSGLKMQFFIKKNKIQKMQHVQNEIKRYYKTAVFSTVFKKQLKYHCFFHTFSNIFFLRVVESTAAICMLAYTVIIVFFNDLGGSEFEKTQIA